MVRTTAVPSLRTTRLADTPIRAGRVDGQWRLAVRDGTWRTLDATLRCFDDLADVRELARVEDWAAEVLGVRRVELVADRRGWILHIED